MPRVRGFDDLYDHMQVVFRRRQVVMIAGRPGHGKSLVALALSNGWAEQGRSVLYFSADSGPDEQVQRLVAHRTGMPVGDVEDCADSAPRYVHDELAAVAGKLRFHFGPITGHGLDNEVMAHVMAHNAFPDVIVIDNLQDMEYAESGYHEQTQFMVHLKTLSEVTGSLVLVLHHASETSALGDTGSPPPRAAILNKLSQKPQVILTVAASPAIRDGGSSTMRIAAVKNRTGRQKEDGSLFAQLAVDFPTMRVMASGPRALGSGRESA